MLLRGLAIFSLISVTTVLATNDRCKLVVYNEEDYKGFHETLLDTKLVEMEIKSFHVHGPCRWSMSRVVKVK